MKDLSVPNLESLNLGRTAVVDVSPLAGMSSLCDLYSNATRVTDISALASFPELEFLELRDTSVDDRRGRSRAAASFDHDRTDDTNAF